MSNRFEIFYSKKLPEVIQYRDEYLDIDCWCLVDLKNLIVVGTDYSEPEDAILVRSFSWVLDLVNKLDAERNGVSL